MATKKATAKKPAARKSGKRTVTARARKPAGTLSRRSAPKAARPVPQASWSFTRMLADIFGMRRAD